MKSKRRFVGFFRLAAVLLLSVIAAQAQATPVAAPKAVNVGRLQTRELDSKQLARKVWYRVILPVDYNKMAETRRRYPVIYLLHGLYGHFDNWTDKTKLAEYAKAYNIIIVTPEGGDNWYTDSSAAANDKFESYIIRDLIPEIDRLFRTITERRGRAIAGLSMGGYGALKFGVKYPDLFAIAGSFSGALRAAEFNEKNAGAIGKSIDVIYGNADSTTRKENDLFELYRTLTPEKIKGLPFIYLDCGTEDFLFQSNRDFAALLVDKKIAHEYRQLPGAHTWDFWNKDVQEFLEIAGKLL